MKYFLTACLMAYCAIAASALDTKTFNANVEHMKAGGLEYEEYSNLADKTLSLIDPATELLSDKLAVTADQTLHNLFFIYEDTAYKGNFYQRTEWLHHIYNELETRGIQTQEETDFLYKEFYDARDFNSAKLFYAGHVRDIKEPLLSFTMPDDMREAKFRVFDVTSSTGMVVMALPMEKGPHIVISGFPSCHFAKAAKKALETDPDLQSAAGVTYFVTYDFDMDSILRQKMTSGHFYYVAWSQSDWVGVNFSRSPTFNFYKDGKLVYTFDSWPKEGNKKLFLEGMSKIGIK